MRKAQTNHAPTLAARARRAALIMLPFAIVLGVDGCRSLPPSKPLETLSPVERAGYDLFQSRCAECHYANSQRALHGPGLQGIFKVPYLPSGQPANDDRVLNTVQHGRGNMPAFGNLLDDSQTSALLAYLHTL